MRRRVLQNQPPPAGHRAAIITNSGGTRDGTGRSPGGRGVILPELSVGLRAQLAELLPDYAEYLEPSGHHA